MRVFAGEYVCGGGLANTAIEQIPSSLRLEGSAMLRAITEDLVQFAEVVVPLDPRFIKIDLPTQARLVEMKSGEPLLNQWSETAQACEAAIIIAPETDGVLAKAVAMLRAAGVQVIAGSGDFLRTASDKLLTAKALIAAGVPHPAYVAVSDHRHAEKLKSFNRFVIKPRDGCGTQEIQVFDSLGEAHEKLDEHSILQGWVVGQPVSIAMVASPSERVFLPAVDQQLQANSCEYAGGCGPLEDDAQRRLTALAVRTIEAMPPTVRGFVGFDMLLGQQASDDCVIEVNPRLTTSYVGLRKMIKGNLAARLFDIETGPVGCRTSPRSVRWKPDGQIWVNDQVHLTS